MRVWEIKLKNKAMVPPCAKTLYYSRITPESLLEIRIGVAVLESAF